MSPFGWLALRWRRWALRRNQYRGGAAVMEALYDKPDPWKLASPDETRRFAATNALILTHRPDPVSLLEIGCGEGIQTAWFARIAGHVTGIDVSAQALARAQDAVPGATFLHGELVDVRPSLPRARYDVATLCEVLYYIADPAAALSSAQDCADMVVATIYEPQARALEPLLRGDGWREAVPIIAGHRRWRAWVWIGPGRPSLLS